jgi:hypothetical protein
MKRALALLAVFGVLAFGAAPFPAFTGKWDATVCILPSTSLTSALTLTTNVAGFDVSGYFRFTAGGLDRVSFSHERRSWPLLPQERHVLQSLCPRVHGQLPQLLPGLRRPRHCS